MIHIRVEIVYLMMKFVAISPTGEIIFYGNTNDYIVIDSYDFGNTKAADLPKANAGELNN